MQPPRDNAERMARALLIMQRILKRVDARKAEGATDMPAMDAPEQEVSPSKAPAKARSKASARKALSVVEEANAQDTTETAEVPPLQSERDRLLAENAALKARLEELERGKK